MGKPSLHRRNLPRPLPGQQPFSKNYPKNDRVLAFPQGKAVGIFHRDWMKVSRRTCLVIVNNAYEILDLNLFSIRFIILIDRYRLFAATS